MKNERLHKKNASFSGPLSIVLFVVLCFYVLSLVIPLVWGFFASLKGNMDFSMNPVGFPAGNITEWKWSNYSYVIKNFNVPIIDGTNTYVVPFLGLLINTLIYTVVCAAAGAFAPCVMGYLLAQYPNRFSSVIRVMILVAITLPIVGSNASMLEFLRSIGLYDTYAALLLMSYNPITIYLFIYEASFSGLSRAYTESAQIDGAGNFRIFFTINLPLVRNIFFTIFILMFIGRWNDYTVPLMYTPTKPTLAYGVWFINNSTIPGLNWPPAKTTGLMILAIPVLILFVIFNRRIMGNVSMGGVKE